MTNAERQKRYRDKNRVGNGVTATLEHYERNAQMYAKRNAPELLNWGPWLNARQLQDCAPFRANRVPIPGDWDYEGVGHGSTMGPT